MQDFNYNNELSGKIALVTGGTKGTGKIHSTAAFEWRRYGNYHGTETSLRECTGASTLSGQT